MRFFFEGEPTLPCATSCILDLLRDLEFDFSACESGSFCFADNSRFCGCIDELGASAGLDETDRTCFLLFFVEAYAEAGGQGICEKLTNVPPPTKPPTAPVPTEPIDGDEYEPPEEQIPGQPEDVCGVDRRKECVVSYHRHSCVPGVSEFCGDCLDGYIRQPGQQVFSCIPIDSSLLTVPNPPSAASAAAGDAVQRNGSSATVIAVGVLSGVTGLLAIVAVCIFMQRRTRYQRSVLGIERSGAGGYSDLSPYALGAMSTNGLTVSSVRNFGAQSDRKLIRAHTERLGNTPLHARNDTLSNFTPSTLYPKTVLGI